MRHAATLVLASLLGVSLLGDAFAQEPVPPSLGGAALDSAVGAGAGSPRQPAGTLGEDSALSQKPGHPAAGAALRPSAPIAKPPAPPVPIETSAIAPATPANEPSVLPPAGVPFVPEPVTEATSDLSIPDTGPGSINQPLISGVPDTEPVQEEQPVPVRELSLFFGVALILSVGYLTFTARMPRSDDGPADRPSGLP